MARVSFVARRQARYLLVQALYQWQITQTSADELLAQFHLQPQFAKADKAYFEAGLAAVMTQSDTIDQQFSLYLDRKLVELDPIELTILRLATYELTQRLEVPYRVAINEALELAKIFGATDSFKYVNGVLDQVSKQWRKSELEVGHEAI